MKDWIYHRILSDLKQELKACKADLVVKISDGASDPSINLIKNRIKDLEEAIGDIKIMPYAVEMWGKL